ncbi:MAG: threonine synthase [Bacteroidota bacterium]
MMPRPPLTVTGLRCLLCDAVYVHGNLSTCPRCGEQGILDAEYDFSKVAAAHQQPVNRPANIWRYLNLLPVSPDIPAPALDVGWTPVYDVPRLAELVGVTRLLLKDDGQNPTGSLKDRASAIGVMKAREFGHREIACASTGNAASSLAGLAAAFGLQSYIFVPERAVDPKVTQLLIFGATVFRVRGSYEDAFELCRQACQTFGWYNRNSGINPFLVEGKKTAGLEIAEQCREAMPDWVVVSVGDGCTIGGIGKGLQEMHRLGFIPRVPRLLGVQADGARPIVDAFVSGRELVPSRSNTIADSIAVGTPRNWRRAITQVRESGGAMIAVTDDEILDAMRITARLGGVFGEPAGVAGVAGLRRAVDHGLLQRGDTALVVITGNGLKDIQTARLAAGQEMHVEPRLDAVRAAIARMPNKTSAVP